MNAKSALLAIVCLSPMFAQPLPRKPLSSAPDCNIPFSFNATSQTSVPFNNLYVGCMTWYISYSTFNVTGLSLTLQSAQDGGNTPGSFTDFVGPLSLTPYSASTGTGFRPWIRATETGTFGTGGLIAGSIIGWRPGAGSGGGGGGGGGTIPNTTNTLKGDGAGNALAVTGTASNCVLVDGTSTPCSTGAGDVVGPATNSANFIPQWNGANSKTLKNGLPVATTAAASTVVESGAGGTIDIGWIPTGVGLTANPLSQFAATTSAQLLGIISDESGTGVVVGSNGPTFIAPVLGTPASVTLTNGTGLPLGTGVTATFSSPLILTTNTLSCPTCGVTGSPLSQFAATTSAQLAGVISNETGTSLLVFNTSPTLVTPALGTPSSGVMTNMTGLALAGTPMTTKGDLMVTNGTVLNRLAVGTDTFVLTADAASTNGVKWAAVAGTGTVTVVGAGSLTSGACVTGGGTTTIQTPSSLCTVDSSGNSAATSYTASGDGVHSSQITFPFAGTTNGVPATGTTIENPASVTAGDYIWNAAPGTGFQLWTNSSGTATGSIVGSTGSGNVVRATSATLVTPALGTPASGVMTNMTGLALAGTPMTTKGDLLVTNGTVLNRLAVGTDTFVLVADAASTNGVKWAAAGAGTVTSIQTTSPITGGTITSTGTIACGTCGVTGSPLSQFASTTSAQLAGVISDESGTGALIFAGGNIAAGSASTASTGDSSTLIATTAFVGTAITNAIAGADPAIAVLAASTATLTGTYSNGVGGVGATFTITATGAFTLDGISIGTIGQRVLLKDQSSAFQNGVYTATVVGTTGVSAVFTRALDYNSPSNINSTGAIPVQSGTVNGDSSWLLTSSVTTVGTDALTYTRFTYNPTTLVTATGSTPNGDLPAFTATTNQVQDSGIVAANVVTNSANFTNGHVVGATGNHTTADSGVVAANIVSASSPGAGIAHFAGSTQTVTSSTIATGDVAANAITSAKMYSGAGSRSIGWGFGDVATGSALTTSEVGIITLPHNWATCTISGYHIMADAGTATIKTARVATGGTAIPTISNSISTSGVALSSGTLINSTTTSDFTSTTLSAGDTLGFFITAVATAKQITFQLDCDQ